MNKTEEDLLKRNPKVDPKVVSKMSILQNKLPDAARTVKGSDYRITPPLGGQSLAWARKGK